MKFRAALSTLVFPFVLPALAPIETTARETNGDLLVNRRLESFQVVDGPAGRDSRILIEFSRHLRGGANQHVDWSTEALVDIDGETVRTGVLRGYRPTSASEPTCETSAATNCSGYCPDTFLEDGTVISEICNKITLMVTYCMCSGAANLQIDLPDPIQDGDRVAVWLVPADGAEEEAFLEDDYLEKIHRRRLSKSVNLVENLPVSGVAESSTFLRADCNNDGAIDIADPVASIAYLLTGSFIPACLDALDIDDNGVLELSDPVASLTYQFLGGAAPAAPGLECGIDPTRDELDCQNSTSCEEA